MPESDPPISGIPDPDEDIRARARRFLHRVKKLEPADLERVALPATDVRARAAARADAHGAVRQAGLVRLEAETRGAARGSVESAFVGDTYQPTMFGLNWGRSTGRVEDRLAVIAAVEDAALATVARDFIPIDTFDELMQPFDRIQRMHPPQVATYPSSGVARWTRPIAGTILVTLALPVLIICYEAGFPAMLFFMIPIAMVVGIVASAARRRPGPGA